MGKTPDAPAQLNPNKLAAQQTKANQNAAQANVALNRPSQRDQFGNTLNYQRTGTDAQGNPQYQVNQQLGGIGRQTQRGMQGLANQFYSGANNLLNNPMDVNAETEKRIYDLGASRLDPRMDRDQAAMENKLANQGIALGSEAYSNAQNDFGQNKNDAYNSLALQARGQAANEAMAQRQQGVSELSGLAGLGAQYGVNATNPQYAQVPQFAMPGIDMIGLEQARYNQQMQDYQRRSDARNAMIGGIAGTIGTVAGAAVGGPMGAQIGGKLGSSAGSYF